MQLSKITYKNQRYPDILREIAQPPKQLYIRGQLPAGAYVAIVGTRRISQYGRQITYKLAYDLASAGVVIVSGLAFGVDAVAHQAALDAGGMTIAVLASGADMITPAGNYGLGLKVVEHGAIISEYEPGTQSLPQNFVARNRIVAGLSQAVIVTESPASGGSLITANYALEANRQVFAVPGNITSTNSAGTNNLIKSGAIPVTDATDVLAALDLESASSKPVKAQSREEALILELIGQGHNSSDALIRESQLTAGQFANIITLMEITGKVRNLGAGQWMSR